MSCNEQMFSLAMGNKIAFTQTHGHDINKIKNVIYIYKRTMSLNFTFFINEFRC
jgi:hypothetical protein